LRVEWQSVHPNAHLTFVVVVTWKLQSKFLRPLRPACLFSDNVAPLELSTGSSLSRIGEEFIDTGVRGTTDHRPAPDQLLVDAKHRR